MRGAIWQRPSYGGRGHDIVTYIVDRNINYTNVCNVYCKFCAFYRTERDEDHYVLSFEQLDQKLDELTAAGGVQILMQGGHHPKLSFQWYSISCTTSAKNIRTSTFTDSVRRNFNISETFRMPLRDVISEFRTAGSARSRVAAAKSSWTGCGRDFAFNQQRRMAGGDAGGA
jgi:cyclic dehypoxanthinyl futalosine synthase